MSTPAATLPALASRRARAGERPPGEPRRVAYLYVLPGLAVFVAFVLLPLIHAGWISLFAWDGITPGEWVGAGQLQGGRSRTPSCARRSCTRWSCCSSTRGCRS